MTTISINRDIVHRPCDSGVTRRDRQYSVDQLFDGHVEGRIYYEGAALSAKHRLSCDVSPINTNQHEKQVLNQSLFLCSQRHCT